MPSLRPDECVLGFCAAWEARDVERIVEAFTEDGVYHNIPMKPSVGKDAIRRMVGLILKKATSARFEIKHLIVSENVVMTERVDTFQMLDRTIVLPVMGIFEIRGDRIAAWRDYFDLKQWTG